MVVAGLKLNEWAAIIFGVTGLLVSLGTLWRSMRTERNARALALNQRRHEALTLAFQAETSLMIAKRQIDGLLYEARSEGASDMAQQAEIFITGINKQIELVHKIQVELSSKMPVVSSAEELESVIDRSIFVLRPLASQNLLEEQGRTFIDPAQENLRLHRQLRRRPEVPRNSN